MSLLPDYTSICNQIELAGKAELLSYVKPGFYSCRENGATDFPIGVSRFSGLPDLPTHVDWPTCPAGPIPFLAQVNLGELPQAPSRELLPPRGMLYFFYFNPEEGLHFPDEP